MRHPLIRRATYSLLTTLVGLALAYYLMAISPDPARWLSNARSGPAHLVMALVLLVLYGAPAWAITYLAFGLLNIPDPDRPDGPPATRKPR